jgi:DNA-binding IclR family transcriptional regulator
VRIQGSSQQIHANVRPGTVFGLTTTATGRLFCAYLPPRLVAPLVAAELRGAGERVEAGALPRWLGEDLARIRKHGLAATEGKPIPGLNALSAPIFDHTDEIQVAITAIGPSAVLDCSLDSRAARALLAFTSRLSEQLGYRPAA